MKITTTFVHSRYVGITHAVQEVLGKIDVWDARTVPVFDYFYHNKPDILLCDTQIINHNFLEAVKNLDTKIVLFGNSVPEGLNPSVVCAEPSISDLMKKHLEAENNVIYIHDYVDSLDIGGEYEKQLRSDIGMIFPKTEIDINILKMLLNISACGQFKIIGDGSIALIEYLGRATPTTQLDFLKSTNIAIDLDGKSLLRNAANQVFTLSAVQNSLFPVINEFNCKEVIEKYLKDPIARVTLARMAQDQVLESATNYHRLIDILKVLPLQDYYYYINKAEEKIREIQ